jgi:hypothetical protein
MFKQHCPRCQSLRLQLGFKDSPLPLRAVGIQELLCNNCNLEFRGVVLFGRLERARDTQPETIVNRRRAPRFKVKIPVTVAAVVKDTAYSETKYSTPLQGHTLDLSSIGVAVILPGHRAGEYDLTAPDQRLWIKLQLPTGPVIVRAAYVRHETLKGKDGGFVIGAHIRKIEEKDAERLHEYLKTLV